MEGEKADVGEVLEQLGRPELLADMVASVTNSVDNSVLVQRRRLMFVNFSIFVFRERHD